jgi:CubicO group peptidase (beta-lactamase class C family)
MHEQPMACYRFGLEWTRHGGQDVIFHGGGLWGFRTLLLRLPQQRLSVILLSNSDRVEPDWEQLADAAVTQRQLRGQVHHFYTNCASASINESAEPRGG